VRLSSIEAIVLGWTIVVAYGVVVLIILRRR